MVLSIALVAAAAGVGLTFVKPAIDSYVASRSRAALIEYADVLARSIEGEVRRGLPNGTRLMAIADGYALEFVPVLGAGIYRAMPTAAGSGDVLRFDVSDTSFDVLGPVPPYGVGNHLVIANLGEGSGADFYGSGTLNRSTITTGSNSSYATYSTDAVPVAIGFSAFRFPLASPSARFYTTESPVSYVCDNTTGTLIRYSGYPITALQAAPPAGAARADTLSNKISGCVMRYSLGVTSRTGLISMEMRLSDGSGEGINLVMQMHVSNEP